MIFFSPEIYRDTPAAAQLISVFTISVSAKCFLPYPVAQLYFISNSALIAWITFFKEILSLLTVGKKYLNTGIAFSSITVNLVYAEPRSIPRKQSFSL